jgi:peroxiredoxin
MGAVLGILFGAVCFLVGGATWVLTTGFFAMPQISAPAQTTPAPPQEPTPAPTERPAGSPQVGKLAPDFSLKNPRTGNILKLSRLTGRPVMINFWATWCKYCVNEMPLMEAAYQARAADGLMILAIDVEETSQEVLNFADYLGLSFTFLLDTQGDVAKLYRVHAFPTSFFITPEGKISKIYAGTLTEGELNSYLDKIMK